MSLPLRIAVTLGLLLVIQVGTLWVRGWRASATVVMPDWSESAFPTQFGPWIGEPLAPESDLVRAVGAAKLWNIVFRNASGYPVATHVAIFTKESSGLPHHPRVCYPGNGYRLVQEEPLSFTTAQGRRIDAAVATFERQGIRSAVLYWYQIDTTVLTDSSQMAFARLRHAGPGYRSAIVKVMLDTPADPMPDATNRLENLATLIATWMDRPHAPAPPPQTP